MLGERRDLTLVRCGFGRERCDFGFALARQFFRVLSLLRERGELAFQRVAAFGELAQRGVALVDRALPAGFELRHLLAMRLLEFLDFIRREIPFALLFLPGGSSHLRQRFVARFQFIRVRLPQLHELCRRALRSGVRRAQLPRENFLALRDCERVLLLQDRDFFHAFFRLARPLRRLGSRAFELPFQLIHFVRCRGQLRGHFVLLPARGIALRQRLFQLLIRPRRGFLAPPRAIRRLRLLALDQPEHRGPDASEPNGISKRHRFRLLHLTIAQVGPVGAPEITHEQAFRLDDDLRVPARSALAIQQNVAADIAAEDVLAGIEIVTSESSVTLADNDFGLSGHNFSFFQNGRGRGCDERIPLGARCFQQSVFSSFLKRSRVVPEAVQNPPVILSGAPRGRRRRCA